MDGVAQPFLGAVPALIVSYGPVDAVQAMGLRVELTDAQLVARCRTGDADAWRELVDRFSRYVYAIAVQGFKLSEHDAEDVFQEVFTRAYEHLHKLRDDEAIRPWLAQLTRRLCIDRLRAGSTEQLEDDVEIADADDTIARLDESLAVHEALSALPGQLSGDPRSLFRPGRELSHDRRRPGDPLRHDCEPDLPLPDQIAGRDGGKKQRRSRVLNFGDAYAQLRRRTAW